MTPLSKLLKRFGQWLEETPGQKYGIKLFPSKYKPYSSEAKSFLGLVRKSEHDRVVQDRNDNAVRAKERYNERMDIVNKDFGDVFHKFSNVRIERYNNSDIICCTAEVTKVMLENLRPGEERYIDYLGEDLKRKIVRELKHYLCTREVHQVEETKYRYVTPGENFHE